MDRTVAEKVTAHVLEVVAASGDYQAANELYGYALLLYKAADRGNHRGMETALSLMAEELRNLGGRANLNPRGYPDFEDDDQARDELRNQAATMRDTISRMKTLIIRQKDIKRFVKALGNDIETMALFLRW